MSKEEKIVTERYYVDGIVCDWGVFDRLSYEEENKLVCICNSHKNALTIAEILNTDYYPDEKGYVSVWEDKQLAELKAENERLCQQVININKENNKLRKFQEDILRVQAEPYKFWKEIEALQQQLKEKDEEIERLKKEYAGMKGWFEGVEGGLRVVVNKLKSQFQSNTKQVCEKIREWLKQNLMVSGGKANGLDIEYARGYNDCRKEIKEFLDQIEEKNDELKKTMLKTEDIWQFSIVKQKEVNDG